MVSDRSELSRNDHEFIDRRINELDRRVDHNLGTKLEAVEKLFALTIATKSDALNIAMSRIQQDNTACAARCNAQVKEFYACFAVLKEKINIQSQVSESIKRDLQDDAKDLIISKEILATDLSRIESKVDNVEPKVEDILRWKEGFLVKNLSITIVTSYAIIQVAFKSISWLLSYFAKMGLPGAGV